MTGVESTHSLIPSGNRISDGLYAYINQEKDPEGTNRNRIRMIAKAILAVNSLARSLIFAPISPNLGPYTQGIFATGYVMASSAVAYSTGSRFVDGFLPQKSGLDKAFPAKQLSSWDVATTVLSVAISAFSQLPAVYPAMQYHKGPSSIPFGLVVLVGGIVYPLRSIQLSMKKCFNKAGSEKQEQFVKLLQENRQRFIRMNLDEQKQAVQGLEEIKAKDNSQEKIDAYWNHLISESNLPVPATLSEIEEGSTQSVKTIGLVLTLAYEYVTGKYIFVKTKENILDNDHFAKATSALVVVSEAFLIGTNIIDSLVKLFHSTTGINKGAYANQASLAEKFRKKTTTRLQALGVVCNLLALGITHTVYKRFFKNKTENTAFEVLMCSANFLFFYTPLSNVISNGVEQIISYRGTNEEKAAIKLAREYQELVDTISKISPADFEELLHHLPMRIQEALTRRRPDQSEHSDHALLEDVTSPMRTFEEVQMGIQLGELGPFDLCPV